MEIIAMIDPSNSCHALNGRRKKVASGWFLEPYMNSVNDNTAATKIIFNLLITKIFLHAIKKTGNII